jgi:hypothetical protein
MGHRHAMMLGAGVVVATLLISNTETGMSLEQKISDAVGGGTTGKYVVGAVVGAASGWVLAKFIIKGA